MEADGGLKWLLSPTKSSPHVLSRTSLAPSSHSAPPEPLTLASSEAPIVPLNRFGMPISSLDLELKALLGVAEFANDAARIQTLGLNLPPPLYANRVIFHGFPYESPATGARDGVKAGRRVGKTHTLKLALGLMSEEDLRPEDYLTEEEYQREYAPPGVPPVVQRLPMEEDRATDEELIPSGDEEETGGGESAPVTAEAKGKDVEKAGQSKSDGLEIVFEASPLNAGEEVDEFVVKEANVTDLLYKTSMCKLILAKKKCHYGARCKHAHSKAELRPSPLLKTMLCRDIFQPKGGRKPHCPLGNNCQRAHTLEELREIPMELGPLHWKRHPKKSQMCKDHLKGFCAYAHFCWFAHQPEDLVKPVNAPDSYGPKGGSATAIPIYRIMERETEDDPTEDEDDVAEGGDASTSSKLEETAEYQGFQGATWDD